MLSRRIVRLAQTPRTAARLTAVRFYNPEQKGDPGHQAHNAGVSATDPRNASPVDAASPDKGKRASHGHIGNQEGLGFADQVGSQSSSAHHHGGQKAATAEGMTGEESITPPSFVDAVKSKLGFKTTAGEDKQNRGGGVGVTGTGQVTADRAKRTIHTSAVARADKTQGQAPQASREPKESTNADQNDHLKHKSPSAPDSGKGNAAPEPTLPSKQIKKSTAGQHRGFATSARVSAQAHSSETYFKEADKNEPSSPKIHQVDSSSGGAPVAHVNEKPGTGEFDAKGPGDPEYSTVNQHDDPYGLPPTGEKDQKLRYGGEKPSGVLDESPSKPDEGPAGKDADGRKPEGRS